ncbi:MAG TPA: MFS transporter, partial [Ktedonobacterales bacterium]
MLLLSTLARPVDSGGHVADTVKQSPKRSHLLTALGTPSFALLWSGQAFSTFGDGVYFVALAWLILQLTGSASAMAAVLVAASIPRLIFLLVGGVVADRLPRRLVMLWADLGRGVAVAIIALLTFQHSVQMWHLIALGVFFGFAQAFFIPAYAALSPLIVPQDHLRSANSLNALSRTLSGLVGPGIGAALVATVGISWAFAFDALTFVVSAASLAFVTARPLTPAAMPAAGRISVRQTFADLSEGFKYVAGSAWLWVTIVLAAVANVLRAPFAVSLPRLVNDGYPQQVCFSASVSGGLHLDGVCLFGSISVAISIGGIAATVLTGMLHTIPRRGLVAYLALLFGNVMMLLFAVPWGREIGPWMLLLAGAADGFAVMVFEVIWVTVLQEMIPAEKLGRVSSVDWLGSLALGPVGIALIGILTDKVGAALIFGGCALLLVAVDAIG